jgi:hypothetical protein
VKDNLLRLNFQRGMDGKVKDGREVCTLDGTVDWHGRPAVRQRTGSWVAAILILGNYPIPLTYNNIKTKELTVKS